jgi:hypothetical protein
MVGATNIVGERSGHRRKLLEAAVRISTGQKGGAALRPEDDIETG